MRFENAVYSVTVGAGGVRDGDEENRGASGYNANGKPSMLGGGKISVKALGGGGGGLNGDWSNSNKAPGGKGGGGMAFPNGYDSPVVAISYSGVDTLGGGGAGTCFAQNHSGSAVSPSGNGGNGVVIVRIIEVQPLGLSVIMQ